MPRCKHFNGPSERGNQARKPSRLNKKQICNFVSSRVLICSFMVKRSKNSFRASFFLPFDPFRLNKFYVFLFFISERVAQ
ncbi:hypothetical protein I7I48_07309 [Histoplasma ohiense]|nr:hypothetical protein I7I48_07309 [Histoplasma ohiense (nom. inval.)]